MKIFANKNGSILILVALSLVILLGFGALALDLGYVYMKNVELQTTADAASLAGAGALVSYGNDLTKVEEEIHQMITKNFAAQKDPSGNAAGITTITYYKNSVLNSVDPNQVEVEVNRSGAGGNPVTLFLARAMGFTFVNLSATARAEAYNVGGSRCLKPFAIAPNFEYTDANGNKVCDLKKNESEAGTIRNITKMSLMPKGTPIILKYGTSDNIVPGQYNPIALPPINKGGPDPGGSNYRDNISGCEGSNKDSLVEIGDLISTEPGNMVGPTKQGIQNLIDLDPGASWSAGSNSIIGSSFVDPMASPRIGIIVVYDMAYSYPSPGRNDPLKVLELVGVFIEGINGQGDVTGRLVGAMAIKPGGAGPGNNNLLYWIRLIKDSTRGA